MKLGRFASFPQLTFAQIAKVDRDLAAELRKTDFNGDGYVEEHELLAPDSSAIAKRYMAAVDELEKQGEQIYREPKGCLFTVSGAALVLLGAFASTATPFGWLTLAASAMSAVGAMVFVGGAAAENSLPDEHRAKLRKLLD